MIVQIECDHSVICSSFLGLLKSSHHLLDPHYSGGRLLRALGLDATSGRWSFLSHELKQYHCHASSMLHRWLEGFSSTLASFLEWSWWSPFK